MGRRARRWRLDDALEIEAPPACDLFRDPGGREPETGAPRLLGPVEGDFQLSARVRCTFAGAFDAGALLLWAGESMWVKLAFEVSPDGEPGVVSVVTDGLSDDANAFAVPGDAVWLRVSRLGAACALHARLDDEPWRFVRHLPFAADAAARRLPRPVAARGGRHGALRGDRLHPRAPGRSALGGVSRAVRLRVRARSAWRGGT